MPIENSGERNIEIGKEIKKECIEWIQSQLIELVGVEFTEEETAEKLQLYLEKNNRDPMELNQEDKENIYGDVLIEYLDGEVE
jgi:ribosome maturation factor RimP